MDIKLSSICFFIYLALLWQVATLDNVVTLYHADGDMDIGRWPRLLLALSGLVAGFLYDIQKRRYMNIIMYCITLLSVICILLIVSGNLYVIGL